MLTHLIKIQETFLFWISCNDGYYRNVCSNREGPPTDRAWCEESSEMHEWKEGSRPRGHPRACPEVLRRPTTPGESLTESVFQTYFKISTNVHVPKENNPASLKKYCPIELTSVVMKCFEKGIKDFIFSFLLSSLDPLQLSYQSNTCMDDAISSLHPFPPGPHEEKLCEAAVYWLQFCFQRHSPPLGSSVYDLVMNRSGYWHRCPNSIWIWNKLTIPLNPVKFIFDINPIGIWNTL